MKKIIISSILILFLLSGVADAATIIVEDADQTWNLTLNDTNFDLNLNPRIKLEYVDSLDYIWNSKLNSTPTDLNNSINAVKPRIKLEYVDSLDYIWNSKLNSTPTDLNNSINAVKPRIKLEYVDSLDYIWNSNLITFQSENRRPVANAGGPYYSNVNELIQFYGSGTDPDGDAITAYAWDFDGDGVTDSTLQNTTQSWAVAGTYYPTLAVQDVKGNWSEPDQCTVIVGLSDLIISHLTWTPSNFTEGQVVTFNAVIANIGIGNTTTDFYTRFLIDDVIIGEESVAGLDAGNSTNVTQTWTATSGEHTLKAVVDVYDAVVESNETNNWLSKNLSQVQSVYLLFIGSNAESYTEGDNATFSAKASRKSSPDVYLSDTEVNLTLAILAENGSVIFTSPMSYASTVFSVNVSLTGYSKGNYTARVTLKDTESVTVEESILFKIVANFSVSVSTDKMIYDRDEIVHITGSAQYTDGSPVSNAPVILNIHVKGYTRSYSLVTGTAGNFSHYYNPSFMEAGNVTAEASVASETLQRSAQTSYTMYGLYMNPLGVINCWMSKNSSDNLTFSLRNYGESDLNGIAVNIIDEDTGDGVDTLLLQPPAATLMPDEEQEFTLNLIAGNVATSQANFSVSVTSTEGSTEEADLFIHLVEAVPIATVNPTAIEAGMNPDDLLVRTVNITNSGYESMNDVNISLPSLDWISVTATDLGSIAPGTGKSFDIILHPANDTAPGVYPETLTISSSNHQPVNLYLSITVTSSQQGDLMFHVINDIGENISGASIVIQNQDVLTQIYQGTTNETGYYLFELISTGRYNFIVQASGHTSVVNSALVAPAVQTLVEPVLPKRILGVQLTVTQIQIGDEYDIVLNLTFETEVPPPILIPKPLYIRHRVNFTDPVYETDGAITISNPGLISIFNVTVDSSLLTDVDITFPTGEAFFVGELKANSSVTIPYHLHVTSVSCDSDHYRNSIRLKGDYIYFEEYSDVTHNVYLTSEIPVFVNMYDCPGGGDGYPIDKILDYFNFSYLLPGGCYTGGNYTPWDVPKPIIREVETVHERVKFSISQDATLERDAFAAGLELTNKLTDKNIEGVKVVLDLTDELGSDAADMFYVNQTFLININAIDGTGVINPAAVANIDWLLVPKPGAGGTDPAGQDYSVQAFIDYTVDGAPFSVNSTEVQINVMPQPLLNLTYMVPREVKADTPFNITLNVTNVGYGVARNLKLDSAQPMIYENQAGLLVAFELIGSGIVGEAESDSMLIQFGDIAPGESKTGYWIMTASLDGEFTEFKGSFSHSNAVGGAETSLIRNITYFISNFTAEIVSPEDGATYYDFEPISFVGTAYNGTEPLTYEWESFISGHLSSNQSFNETLRVGLHAITLKVTDKNGITDTDTHTIRVLRETMDVYVGAKYNPASKTVDISAYAFDRYAGEKLTSGIAKYDIFDINETTTGLNGDLIYNLDSEKWESNNIDIASLTDGDYNVKVAIKTPTGYGIGILKYPFVKLEGHGNLYGYLIDGTNSTTEYIIALPNVEVSLYASNDFYKSNAQPIAKVTTNSTGMYSFDQQTNGEPLPVGYYVIVTERYNKRFESQAFRVGAERVRKDTWIFEKLDILNPRMDNLLSGYIKVMEYETGLMAEISGRFHKDLGYDINAYDVTLFLLDNFVEVRYPYAWEEYYGIYTSNEYFVLLGKHLFWEMSKEVLKQIPVYYNSIESEKLPKIVLNMDSGVSENYLKNTEYYGNVQVLLNNTHKDFTNYASNTNITNELNIVDAKKVISQQKIMLNEITSGYSNVIVPLDPSDSATFTSLRDSYGCYMDTVVTAEKTKWFNRGIKSSIIIGKVVTIGTPYRVAVYVVGKLVKPYTTYKEIKLKNKIGETGALSYCNWVTDLSKLPNSYGSTSDFLIKEAKTPYYLSNSNDFSADLNYESSTLKDATTYEKPVEIKAERNHWYSHGFSDRDPIEGEVTVNINNTGNVKSTYRVFSQGVVDKQNFWSTLNVPIFKIGADVGNIPITVSNDFDNIELAPNEQDSLTIKFKGYYFTWNNYFPHRLILRVFSGPFEIGSKLYFYRVVDPEDRLVNSRTAEGILTENDDTAYLPSITKIASDNLTSSNSSSAKIFTSNRNTTSLEFDMLYTFGTPVDLHVYDEKGQHIGYNILTDKEETEFPAMYSGRFQNPERILIPNAGNKTFTVQVNLTYSDYPTTSQVTVYALETPKRPAILSVSAMDIMMLVVPNQTFPIDLFVAESGGQHPIHNVNATITNITKDGFELPLLSQQKIEIGDLLAGSAGNATFILDIPATAPSGNYTGVINVDSDIGPYPVNVTIHVTSKPDLTVSYVDVNRTAWSGENVNITAITGNQGFTNVTNTKLELLVDDVPTESKVVDISSETSRVFFFNWTATTGNHILKVRIDTDNTTDEFNEANNDFETSITVAGTSLCGDVAPCPDCDGTVDMGDVILLLNNVSYPENTRYVLCNDWAGDCRCTDVRDMGDVILLLNNVSYPEESRYVLDCCD